MIIPIKHISMLKGRCAFTGMYRVLYQLRLGHIHIRHLVLNCKFTQCVNHWKSKQYFLFFIDTVYRNCRISTVCVFFPMTYLGMTLKSL